MLDIFICIFFSFILLIITWRVFTIRKGEKENFLQLELLHDRFNALMNQITIQNKLNSETKMEWEKTFSNVDSLHAKLISSLTLEFEKIIDSIIEKDNKMILSKFSEMEIMNNNINGGVSNIEYFLINIFSKINKNMNKELKMKKVKKTENKNEE